MTITSLMFDCLRRLSVKDGESRRRLEVFRRLERGRKLDDDIRGGVPHRVTCSPDTHDAAGGRL